MANRPAKDYSSSGHVIVRAAAMALCIAAASGCSETAPTAANANGTAAPGDTYKVVTTCGMVTDIVSIVAGDRAEVSGLIAEGVDPHLFSAKRSDVKQLLEADVIFYSGLMLEGRMSDDFARVARTGKPVYAVTEGIDRTFLREPPEFEGHWDPHVWMDVSAWSQCVGFVADALGEFDPPYADDYRNRADAFRAELDKLDVYARKVIGSIPEEQRVLVTAHDAFGYFSRAYQIPVESVQGLTTESEAGVADINRLVDLIVERQLKAIFVESSVSAKNVQAVVEGAAHRGWEVAIGGELYSDAMGAPGTYEGSYIGMIDHNATIVARALGGDAPQRGMQGKLRE